MAMEEIFSQALGQMPAGSSSQFMPGFLLFVPLLIVVVLVGVLAFALWIWMIIDCAKRNKFRSGDRVVWILLLVLTGIIGMILYYFMVMRKE